VSAHAQRIASLLSGDKEDGDCRESKGRTANICRMSVTLDVLKLLSGWLNTLARCRVKGRAYDAERGAGWEAEECACGLVAAQADRCARGAGSDQGWGGPGHERSAR